MINIKIAAAYIRVSTEDQTEYSPESQMKQIHNYAKNHGYSIPSEFIYMDQGISGKSTKNRVAFNRMIGRAKTRPKPFDAILLWKFSRFARNREDSIVYKSMLRKQLGIEVISVSENIGNDKMSVLIEALIEAMDEYYSINLSEEVKRGMTERASRGEAVSIPAYGYHIEKGKYLMDSHTAPTVRTIFYDYLKGLGTREIAMKLNQMGLKTARGNLWENRSVEYILYNPVYMGKIRWNPAGKTGRNFLDTDMMITQGNHTPIVDPQLFLDVQKKLLAEKSRQIPFERTAPSPVMLGGLVRCSHCGATLTQTAKGKGLQCHQYAKGRCSESHYISLKKINEILINGLTGAFGNRTFSLSLPQNRRIPRGGRMDTEALIKKEESKLQRAKMAFEQGVYSLEDFTRSRQEIMQTIAAIKETEKPFQNEKTAQNALLLKGSSPTQTVQQKENFPREKSKNLLYLLTDERLAQEEKNILLKTFIHHLVLNRTENTIDVFLYL